MGGLPCAKNIIDNGAAFKMSVSKQLAALEKSITCMSTSIVLYAHSLPPTEEQEEGFIKSTAEVQEIIQLAIDKVARRAAEIEAYVREDTAAKKT